MDITYLGAGSVRLAGRQISLVFDPYGEDAGLGKLKAASDVALVSSPDVKAAATEGMLIDGPGEYEVKGALVTAIPARLHVDDKDERGTMYAVVLDDIKVVFTGNIAPELTDKQVEALGEVDVLLVPVGNHGLTLDATSAASLVSRLEPKYVVPTHYDDGAKYPMPQDPLDKFLKEIGSAPEPVGKLKLTGKDMPLETTVVVLELSGS